MIPTEEISGTYLQGHITLSYKDLVKVFGEPHNSYDNHKTDVEWSFIKEINGLDNVIFTIYNWKNGPAYLEKGKVEEITEWNIGGYDTRALDVVMQSISMKGR